MNRIFLIIAFVSVCGMMYSQTNDLPEETEEAVKQQAKVKVDAFTQYVSFVASKQYADDVRERYAEAAMKLFLGDGKAYTDVYGNEKPAPSMEVSSINSRTKAVRLNSYPVATYLKHLQYLNYSSVEVKSSKACFVESLKKIGDNLYKTTLTYVQIFIGKRDGVVVYRDTTRKTIEVYLRSTGTDGYQRWDIKLGDIQVSATEAE